MFSEVVIFILILGIVFLLLIGRALHGPRRRHRSRIRYSSDGGATVGDSSSSHDNGSDRGGWFGCDGGGGGGD